MQENNMSNLDSNDMFAQLEAANQEERLSATVEETIQKIVELREHAISQIQRADQLARDLMASPLLVSMSYAQKNFVEDYFIQDSCGMSDTVKIYRGCHDIARYRFGIVPGISREFQTSIYGQQWWL